MVVAGITMSLMLHAKEVSMKRALLITAALLGALTWALNAPVDALAWEDCREKECTLSTQCIPLCPPCTGAPGNPGVCWYIDQP